MTKIKFSEILANKANFAIHCKTASEAKALFGRLQKEGFRWNDGENLNASETYWSEYESDTVYSLNIEKKESRKILAFTNLYAESATPFTAICFCEDCKVCEKNAEKNKNRLPTKEDLDELCSRLNCISETQFIIESEYKDCKENITSIASESKEAIEILSYEFKAEYSWRYADDFSKTKLYFINFV
jgi:hypothetical protein